MINFNCKEYVEIKNFKNGCGKLDAIMEADELNRIIRGKLSPGSSIGLHKHEMNSEIIYIISGSPKVIVDGTEERLSPNTCTYCKKGSQHTMINDTNSDVEIFAVVCNQ